MKYLIWIIGIYMGYCAFLYIMQRSMIFPVRMIPVTEFPPAGIPGVEQVWLKSDQAKTECWFMEGSGDQKEKPVMILAHGNAELIDNLFQLVQGIHKMGISLFLVEYPGYGRSEGKPSQKSITETYVKAYDYLESRENVDFKKIVGMGRSLGGGAVCALAEKREIAALIIQSSFTSAASFAKNYLVPPFLMRDPFDNMAVIQKYKNPVLVMHGKNDEIISVNHGKKLASAAEQGTLILYNCGHNDFPDDVNSFYRDIELFLKESHIIL